MDYTKVGPILIWNEELMQYFPGLEWLSTNLKRRQ